MSTRLLLDQITIFNVRIMIEYCTGNLLKSDAEALVNTVNTVGVMGKGIALQFKTLFSHNYSVYRKTCKAGKLEIGQLLSVMDYNRITGDRLIVNFPSKTHWRKPSEYDYIKKGLTALRKLIIDQKIQSIAIPPLGCGNGGLDWIIVKSMIEESLSDISAKVYLYEPANAIAELPLKRNTNLTPARAMLLYVAYRLVQEGEFLSEFSAEKVCYFLQRFGAQDQFRLQFKAKFYGPYSGKVKHLLYQLNGVYLEGYQRKDTKPFEALDVKFGPRDRVEQYLAERPGFLKIAKDTDKFLTGLYSEFGLELLSSMDFVARENKLETKEEIRDYLYAWSHRKRTKFSDDSYIQIAYQQLLENALITTKNSR